MKKIVWFILLQLICICLLAGGLLLYHNSIIFDKSHPTTIKIMNGNLIDSTLLLEPNLDTINVYRLRKVTWIIDSSSNVDSFRIEKKDTSKEIFFFGLEQSSHHKISAWGTVYPVIRKDTMFSYNIYWKMSGEKTERKFDPKLAVISSSFAPIERMIYIVYAILALLSFSVFRTAKKIAPVQ